MHGKKALLILLAQYHTLFTKLGMILHTQWGGPPGPRGSPWTRCFSMESVSSQLEQADAGLGRGPGGPPHSSCRCSVAGTVCGIFLLASAAWGADFSGKSALEYTRKAVAFGPRPPASPANLKLQAYIQSQLQLLRCQVSFDAFKATTPIGPVAMRNIIAKFPGTSGRAVAITGHFDTKSMPGTPFVGANDGGTSTGLLLELAHAVNSMPHPNDIYLVWFDGEEAYGEWSDTNGIYGSRHLAEKWAQDGTLSHLTALINVDMIGDINLGIMQEGNSSLSLLHLVWQTATELGYGKYFLDEGFATEDDHLPFLNKGVRALDLIDFDYGPNNQYWHTAQDTMDKVSAHSLDVVGNVLVAVLRKLQ